MCFIWIRKIIYLLLWTSCVNLRVFKILGLWDSSRNWILFPCWMSALIQAWPFKGVGETPQRKEVGFGERMALDAWIQLPSQPFPTGCDLGQTNRLHSLKQQLSNFSTLGRTQERWVPSQSLWFSMSRVGPQMSPGDVNTVQGHTLRNTTVILSFLIFKVGSIVFPSLDCCGVWRQNLTLTFLPVQVHLTQWPPVCFVLKSSSWILKRTLIISGLWIGTLYKTYLNQPIIHVYGTIYCSLIFIRCWGWYKESTVRISECKELRDYLPMCI